MFNERTRAYVYRVFLALVPVAVAYGVVSGEEAALWGSVVATVLGFGLATANTSTAKLPSDEA